MVDDRRDQRFRREERLRTGADFERVYQARTTASDGVLLVFGLPNDGPYTRLGLSVSRKVGQAVVRNRWKRLLREAFRLHKAELPAEFDFIVLPRRNEPPTLEEIAHSLVRLARDVERRVKRRQSRPAEGS
jgi:ribonuclease P protein component